MDYALKDVDIDDLTQRWQAIITRYNTDPLTGSDDTVLPIVQTGIERLRALHEEISGYFAQSYLESGMAKRRNAELHARIATAERPGIIERLRRRRQRTEPETIQALVADLRSEMVKTSGYRSTLKKIEREAESWMVRCHAVLEQYEDVEHDIIDVRYASNE